MGKRLKMVKYKTIIKRKAYNSHNAILDNVPHLGYHVSILFFG